MDRAALKEFAGQFALMSMHAAVMGVVAVCDRTGLFEHLAKTERTSAADLARRSGLEERYVTEALSALAAAGLVEYLADRDEFALTEEGAVCLTDSSSPYYLAGWPSALLAMLSEVPHVAQAMRDGGGVDPQQYRDELVGALDRINGPAIAALLVRKWLPTLPDVVEHLERGAEVADIGCGSGAASVAIAKGFPSSHVVGFDIDERALRRARSKGEGLDNVEFRHVAIADLPAGFDFVVSFDVIHDLPKPLESLQAVRRSLNPDGTFLMVEPNAAATLSDNLNPVGATFYAISLLYCLPVSLFGGSTGLGTAWGPVRARELAAEAGFSRFEHLPIDNPTNAFYRLGH